jgi:hypothetical protein
MQVNSVLIVQDLHSSYLITSMSLKYSCILQLLLSIYYSAVDNNIEEDSKVGQEKKPAAKSTTIIDITKAGNISKDILDITDTPDVATWNKSIQIKGNITKEMIKKLQGRETGGVGGGMTQVKAIQTANNTAIGLKKKGYENLIIDPANQKDVDEVLNSGDTLTDKA